MNTQISSCCQLVQMFEKKTENIGSSSVCPGEQQDSDLAFRADFFFISLYIYPESITLKPYQQEKGAVESKP